ncbi:hypothetical protein [Micromonospora sp. RP3T]|uniref:hypothetical protein n=1 Tax=Micromonospora sp. RP3T TaxID=2135446 RepID=UPI000D1567DA|nr:hypothetical protein [Micromonospora sp. RP3T]PTA47922.1 hypothetical protein C8054_03515 [Micromonospora sp. RP3T]
MTTLARPTANRPLTRDRRPIAALVAVAGGLLLAMLWSFELVDHVIGDSVANSVLGTDAKQTVIGGSAAGALFAFVSGFAGTFTACNIAVFGALPDVAGRADGSRRGRVAAVLAPLGWLALGLVSVAAVYGFVAVLIGSRLPQLSTATVGAGFPVRLVQASVVFGLIGLAFAALGLAALGLLPDPFANRPTARLVTLGALVGGFLVGRPYPLFHKLLEQAVDSHNPFYGALALVLQSLGNILVMVVLALLLVLGTRGGVQRWLSRPGRAGLLVGVALLVLGAFLVFYWDVRLPAKFGYGWFPTMPWNA